MLRENLTLPSLGNLFLNWSFIALGWFFWLVGVLKTKKCKKRCVGFEGNCCQSFFFFKNPCFFSFLAITWPLDLQIGLFQLGMVHKTHG